MNEAALTLEGWYALHDFRSLNWTAWTAADDEERAVALEELHAFMQEWGPWKKPRKAAPPCIPSLARKLIS